MFSIINLPIDALKCIIEVMGASGIFCLNNVSKLFRTLIKELPIKADDIALDAIKINNIKFCEYLLDAEMNPESTFWPRKAAFSGSLNILRWLLRCGGGQRDDSVCVNAAVGGHLVILKWLRGCGCRWDEYTCAGAIRSGHLDILKWVN